MILNKFIMLIGLLYSATPCSSGSKLFKRRQDPSSTAESIPNLEYDVIVVGGGPSGLSALSSLARVRRTALLIDSGEYRNNQTRYIHDVIGSDGMAPWEFRAKARDQIARYPTAFLRNGTVTSITRTGDNSSFLTTISDGQKYMSRKIILATGIEDILPSTPGILEAWGGGMYWCTWCDSWEHRDQPLGIITRFGPDIVKTVLSVINLNKDIIVFVNGTDTPAARDRASSASPDWLAQLDKLRVKVENKTITAIERLQDGGEVRNSQLWQEYDIFEVRLEDGTRIQRGAFLISLPNRQHSYLGAEIGVDVFNERIRVDPTSMRAAPGVWGIGDANNDSTTNVPHALYTGKKAAVNAHLELAKENMTALTLTKRSEQELLETMDTGLEKLWSSKK